jgi:hypothetical protein
MSAVVVSAQGICWCAFAVESEAGPLCAIGSRFSAAHKSMAKLCACRYYRYLCLIVFAEWKRPGILFLLSESSRPQLFAEARAFGYHTTSGMETTTHCSLTTSAELTSKKTSTTQAIYLTLPSYRIYSSRSRSLLSSGCSCPIPTICPAALSYCTTSLATSSHVGIGASSTWVRSNGYISHLSYPS